MAEAEAGIRVRPLPVLGKQVFALHRLPRGASLTVSQNHSNSRGGDITSKYNTMILQGASHPWLLCEVTAAMLRNPPLRVNYYISGIHQAGGPRRGDLQQSGSHGIQG